MLISSEGSTRDKGGHCCAISTKSRGEWSSPEEMYQKNGLYRLNDSLLCFMDFLWVIENADGYKNVLRKFDKVNTNHRTRQEQKIPATANTLCMGNLYIQRNVCIWPIPKAANTPNTYTTFMKTRAIYIDPFFFLFFLLLVLTHNLSSLMDRYICKTTPKKIQRQQERKCDAIPQQPRLYGHTALHSSENLFVSSPGGKRSRNWRETSG